MKFATHVLLFGQEKWIMKNIENSYPHVDKIYISYSKLPWNYNPLARKQYNNNFDINIIKNSKYIDKIHIIEGDWLTEESQRNECIKYAKNDNIDYLIIHDADEFYFYNDFIKIIDFIKKNPSYDVYNCAWYNFWKTFNYITVDENNIKIAGYPDIVINLNNNINFIKKRKTNGIKNITIKDVICYHGSYVLSDIELKEKLKTWGHYTDFDVDKWYNDVWLNWNIDKFNLHPITPSAWYKAIQFNDVLPEILNDFN